MFDSILLNTLSSSPAVSLLVSTTGGLTIAIEVDDWASTRIQLAAFGLGAVW